MKAIYKYFLPINNKNTSDIYEDKNQKLFIYIMLITSYALAPFIIVNFILDKFLYVGIDTVIFILMTSNLFCYKYKCNYKTCFSLHIFYSTMLLALTHMVSSPQVTVTLIWTPLLILVSFYMAGSKRAIPLSLLILCTLLSSEIFSNLSFMPHEINSIQDIKTFNIMHIFISSVTALFLSKKIMGEEKLLFKKIQTSKTKIESVERFNTTLLKTLAHDLSNPLTVIEGYFDLLKKNRNCLDRYMPKFDFQIQKMIDIVSQAKIYQTTKEGKNKFKIEKVNLSVAIEKSVQGLIENIKSKNIKINKNIIVNDCVVNAEPKSLSHNVITNILSNAIKFSKPNESIDIKIEEINDLVRLSIQDYGTGMSESIKENIFSPTLATTTKGTNGEKGTGYGMPIAKLFLENYDAKIAIETKLETKDKIDNNSLSGTKIIIDFKKAA